MIYHGKDCGPNKKTIPVTQYVDQDKEINVTDDPSRSGLNMGLK